MSHSLFDGKDGRHYRNDSSLKDNEFLRDKFSDSHDIKNRIQLAIAQMLERLENKATDETEVNDHSVYTGYAGISLMYLHLHSTIGQGRDDAYLSKAHDWLSPCLRHAHGRRVTFLCGDAGPLAIGAVIYHKLGEQAKSKDCVQKLLALGDIVTRPDSDLPDEILYGRAGYLYSLHFIQQHLGPQHVPDGLIDRIHEAVTNSGRALARKEGDKKCPFMYEWHGSKYLGAAHGLSGIFYLLMQSSRLDIKDDLKRAVDYMLSLQYPSGNCPSSLESSGGDRLVHWCHGAPGWVFMFARAYEVFGDERYLRAAERCADCVWSRGLLQKGYGICHGSAGNAYTFLRMYRLTGKDVYLHRAFEFGEWCTNYGNHGCRIADRPYSMFEGLAGTIYFLADLLEPQKARFPAFEVD